MFLDRRWEDRRFWIEHQ